LRAKRIGLPKELNDNHACQLYEGTEYKEFWKEKAKHNLDLLERDIVSSLIPASGHRIIDIGCGFGRLGECYRDRFEQIVMLDGSVTLLRQAQEVVGERATYIAADANHLPFRPSSFDCILLIRVFHHLYDSQLILNEMRRLLCNQGTFVFNYCSKLSLRRILLWIMRLKRENPLTLEPAGIGTQFITHHPKYVHQLLMQNGYTRIRYLGAGVLDKIPDPSGRLVPLARSLAPIFGHSGLVPWINCRAVASSGETLNDKSKVEDILICPSCHGYLIRQPNAYICKSCDGQYPIRDNIIDFRVDTYK
jgi:ubiquinone/menaquinone biosynthesis C-methylase UbiE